jgi:hypothetical protein
MTEAVSVSVFDPATGETEVQELPEDNYILICGARCQLTNEEHYPRTGTHQLTIKTQTPPPQVSS